MTRSNFSVAALTSIFLALGCTTAAGETDEESVEGTEQAIVWGNGTNPAFFWLPSTQHELLALSRAPLRAPTGSIVATSLTTTAEGRELLRHIVGCALPPSKALSSVAPAASFAGVAGLAPEWETAPLTGVVSRRWLTACLLQTLNGLDTPVPIRLSGSHPALADDPDSDAADYTIPDAIMFGDLFHPDGPAAFACLDDTLVASCDVGFSAYAFQRFCHASPSCGVTLLGPCSASCERDAAGNPTCEDPAGKAYPQSIYSTLQHSICLNSPPFYP